MFIDTVASAESQCLPHSQEKEGLVFIRGQSTGVQNVLREGHRSLFGMSKQEQVTVVRGRVGRLMFSITQHNSLSLRFDLPSVGRGESDPSPLP